MRVLFIRHAQSENNVISSDLGKKLAQGKLTRDQAQQAWIKTRKENPEVSEQGEAQLVKLRRDLSKLAKQTRSQGKIRICCSPMTRTCQTATAVANALKIPVIYAKREICEIGGNYATEVCGTEFVRSPGQAPTADELQIRFPKLNTSSLPAEGPWDEGEGFESNDAAIKRAAAVAAWLRSPDLRDEIGSGGILILVTHADFFAYVMASLYHSHIRAADMGTNPDAHGELPASQLAAMLHVVKLEQFIANNMNSIFARFRMDPATSSLVRISRDGSMSVEWQNKRFDAIYSFSSATDPRSPHECYVQ